MKFHFPGLSFVFRIQVQLLPHSSCFSFTGVTKLQLWITIDGYNETMIDYYKNGEMVKYKRVTEAKCDKICLYG